MDFIKSLIDFKKNKNKIFIIYPAGEAVDLFGSLVDFWFN